MSTATCTIQSNKSLKTATDNMIMNQGAKMLLNTINKMISQDTLIY